MGDQLDITLNSGGGDKKPEGGGWEKVAEGFWKRIRGKKPAPQQEKTSLASGDDIALG